MNKWYEDLNKSPLTPPAWVFGPAWGILYLLMAISLFLYYRSSGRTQIGLILFGVQLALNLLWSRLFFGERLLCGSFVNIFLLNILVFFTYGEFAKASRMAANLLVPYMIWIFFAAYLNLYICLKN
jgi:benzodiazapine receptor